MKKQFSVILASGLAATIVFAAAAVSMGGTSDQPGSRDETVTSGTSGGPANAYTPVTNAGPDDIATVLGCQSRSAALPWGDLGYRIWTPTNRRRDEGTPANAGVRIGAPFAARLIQAYGFDTEFSRRTAIFEFTDGCRRQYQTASFSGDDVRYVADQIDRHPLPTDSEIYASDVGREGRVTPAQIASGEVRQYETQHFNILYGTAIGNFSYTYIANRGGDWQTFLTGAAKTLEDGWILAKVIAGAPMPYASASTKKKINVYICGTGLPFIPDGDNRDCRASALDAITASSAFLMPGSTVTTHEFGHTIQYYSGGFRDKTEAGPIWETGANWLSFTVSPTIDNDMGYYYSNLENGPLWSTSRYGAYAFKSYLFEKDNTRPFLWSTWTGNLRNANGASTEDWTEALVRLATAAGVYPDGYRSFADDMGWYGARLATGDLLNQKTLLDIRNTRYVAKLFTPLATTGTSGTYASPDARPLLQWGTHIIPLSPEQTDSAVTAAVRGGIGDNAAAWRWAIVTLAADGTPRYSPLGRVDGLASGKAVSLTAAPDTRMYLVVTATPYAYQSLGWQPAGAVRGNTFPYTVVLTGATPLTGSTSVCTSVPSEQQGQDLNYNTNGHSNSAMPCGG